MATITATQRTSFAIAQGESVTVVASSIGTGIVQIVVDGTEYSRTAMAAGETKVFADFERNVSIVIECTAGALTYTQGGQTGRQQVEWSDSTGSSLVRPDGRSWSIPVGLGRLSGQPNHAIAAGTALADFTGTWASVTNGGASNTATVNATGGLWGGKSATLQRGSDGTYVSIKQSSLSLTFDSTDVLTLVVDSLTGYVDNDQIRIELSSDNLSTKSLILASTMKVYHGDKLYLSFVMSSATLNGGELVANTFNYLGVRLTASTGAACRVLGIVKNARARPKLLIDFDDAFISQYQHAFPYMAKYGLVGNLAVIQRAVGKVAGEIDAQSYCTLSQLQEMYAAGWDMMTHGYWNHSDDTNLATRAILLADVQTNRDYLLANGMPRAAYHYVYPGGVISTAKDSVGVLAQCGMKTGRLVLANVIPTHPTGVDNFYRMWSRDISQATTIATTLAMVDSAIACGGTVRIHGHRVMTTVADANNEVSVTDWRSLVDSIRDRVRDGSIDCVTISDWYASVSGSAY